MRVRQPSFKVIINKKDVTVDISPYLISIDYKDATEGKCDEVQIELADSIGKFIDEWWPAPGDSITVAMGYDKELFNCGDMEVDEVEYKLSPDIIFIKAISAGIGNPIRTKRSDQHENKTLKQIAQKVADRYGFTINGTIRDSGQIIRRTQELETDLDFLRKLSMEYGHVFSIRGKSITFTRIDELEGIVSATVITREDLIPGGSSIRDKTYDTYKKLHLADWDPRGKKVNETNFEFPEITNVDGFSYNGIVRKDTKEVRSRVDSASEADLKAYAALHSSNSKQQEGVLRVIGNPYLVAGNNFDLVEVGRISGQYHIVSSNHRLTVRGGYTTSISVKRVGFVDVKRAKPKKPRKHKPVVVSIVK